MVWIIMLAVIVPLLIFISIRGTVCTKWTEEEIKRFYEEIEREIDELEK